MFDSPCPSFCLFIWLLDNVCLFIKKEKIMFRRQFIYWWCKYDTFMEILTIRVYAKIWHKMVIKGVSHFVAVAATWYQLVLFIIDTTSYIFHAFSGHTNPLLR